MNPRLLACAGLLLVLCTTLAAHAEDDEEDEGGSSIASAAATASVTNKSGFAVGYEYSHFAYREPGLMSDSGSLNGVKATYVLPGEHVLNVRAETSLVGGSLAYAGQGWDGTPINDTMTDYIFNLRGSVGYTIGGERFNITPEIGAGLRYLNDNGTGSGSYEREISYLYVPVGVGLNSRLNDLYSVGFNAEYDVFIAGSVHTHLSDVNSDFPDLTNSQSSGWGARLSAYLRFTVHRLAFQVEPYFQHWDIGASNSQAISSTQAGEEPANTSDEFGLSVVILL